MSSKFGVDSFHIDQDPQFSCPESFNLQKSTTCVPENWEIDLNIDL
jgi:hypothetical protein